MTNKRPITDLAVLKARGRQLDQALHQARIEVRQAQRRVAKIQRKLADNQRQLHLALKRKPSAPASPTPQQKLEAEQRPRQAQQRTATLAREERLEKQRLRSQTWWGKVR